jgi:hypothetical protein
MVVKQSKPWGAGGEGKGCAGYGTSYAKVLWIKDPGAFCLEAGNSVVGEIAESLHAVEELHKDS